MISASTPAAPQGRQFAALALLAFTHLIISLDYTIVFVALPQIRTALGFSDQSVQWVVSAYVVPYGGLLLLGGRTCDVLGRRRTLCAGLLLFGVASAAGGWAATPALLLAARAVQGIGAAFLFPATLSLINVTFAAGRERHFALSVWAGVGGSGMALGALAGGLLTEAFGWSAVFLVNVPLIVAAVVAALAVLARDLPASIRVPFDLPGALSGTLAMTVTVFVLVHGPDHASSTLLRCAALAAVACCVAFWRIERRARHPLLPLALLRTPGLGAGLAVILLFSATFGALLYFLTLYFQGVLHMAVWQAGLAYMPLYAVIVVMSSVGGRVATHAGPRTGLLSGLGCGLAGMLLVAHGMAGEAAYARLLPGLLLYSAGMGMTFTIMFATATMGVPGHQQGIASGAASSCQQLGSALGIAVLVPLAARGAHPPGGLALVAGTAAAGVALTMAIVALWVGRKPAPAGQKISQ